MYFASRETVNYNDGTSAIKKQQSAGQCGIINSPVRERTDHSHHTNTEQHPCHLGPNKVSGKGGAWTRNNETR